MFNVLNYLDWRGDLSFRAAPFNEIDNLILCELTYARMDDIFIEDMTLEELYTAYKEAGICQDDIPFDPAPLLERAAETERFKGIRISRFVNQFDPASQIQFAAVTFRLGTGLSYISFRGTDNTITGWREDFNMAVGKATPAQLAAAGYLNAVDIHKDSSLLVGGHSKGGNLAIYGAAFCAPRIRNRIVRIYSNDGPGFAGETEASEEFARIARRTVHYVPQGSIVGLLMHTPATRILIHSDGISFWQHNPYSWSVQRTSFERSDKLDNFSEFIDSVLDRWLDGLSTEQRITFINTIFNALEATGVTTINEISHSPARTLKAFMEELRKEDPQMQKDVAGMLKQLAVSSTGVLKDGILQHRDTPEEQEQS
ncbi:MAG: DUF2974 domain-containing protein [Solobacterium sp.]|nr:DUF2974 domain-containing protein [Solobacterium sp.]MBQ6533341.1 DUF2974 domain-containing protein [Solobacterium sp.]MBR0214314.1 DUF2974 domain-containing protein [Solobacterium sp.]